MRKKLIAALLAVAASAGVAAAVLQPAADPSSAEAWEIGPIERQVSDSIGMPAQPTQGRRGWFFDFPYPNVGAGHVHYVTFQHGPLTGKRRIVMRYRIDSARGVRFVPRQQPQAPATVSLYFQRRGDNWTGRGRYGGYRWYAPVQSIRQLAPGEHEMVVDIDGGWTSVMGIPASQHPRAFREAMADADRVGFVLGSRDLRGHGVFATGPARLTVLSFRVI